MKTRIYVDFNSRMEDDQILIPSTYEQASGQTLVRGVEVVLYDEELEAEAVLDFVDKSKHWFNRDRWFGKVD